MMALSSHFPWSLDVTFLEQSLTTGPLRGHMLFALQGTQSWWWGGVQVPAKIEARKETKGEKTAFSLMRSLQFPCVSDRLSLLFSLPFKLCLVVGWGDGGFIILR